MMFIEFSHSIHEYLIDKMSEWDTEDRSLCMNPFAWLYCIISGGATLGSIGIIVFLFFQFKCGGAIAAICALIVAILIIGILSVSKVSRGYLTGSFVMLYISYLLYSALSANPYIYFI